MPMQDDGLHGDGDVQDGIYGATIPAGAYATGQMVRYFVTATDSANRSARLPLFLDPTDQAEYYGTVIQPDYTNSPLPVVHWFVQDYASANHIVHARRFTTQANFMITFSSASGAIIHASLKRKVINLI